MEFEPDPPLKVARQVQMVVLVTSEPFEPDFKTRGIKLGGTIVVPVVQVADQYGNSYDLKTQTVSGDIEVGYWSVELPTDRVYTRVHIEEGPGRKYGHLHSAKV